MPFTDPSGDEQPIELRVPQGVDYQKPVAPSFAQGFETAFERENVLVNLFRASKQARYPDDPNFHPMDYIQSVDKERGTKYEANYLGEFVHVTSQKEADDLMARLDQRDRDEAIFNASGTAGIIGLIAGGFLDPTIFIPGGAIYRGGRAWKTLRTAASIGMAGGSASAIQEGLLQVSQTGRPANESVMNVAASTLLTSDMTLAGHNESELVLEMRALLESEGQEAAVARTVSHAKARRGEIAEIASRHVIPGGLSLYPCVGNCLDDPRLNEGAIACVDPHGIIEPGHVAAFEDGGFLLMKVFIGVSFYEEALAIFWMANPEGFMKVPIAALRFLAPVVGTLSAERGYRVFGRYPLRADVMEEAARFTVGQSLAAIRNSRKQSQ